MSHKKRVTALLFALTLTAALTACSGGNLSSTAAYSNAASAATYDGEMMQEEAGMMDAANRSKMAAPQAEGGSDMGSAGSVPVTRDPTRKLIRTVSLEMETLTYDAMAAAISTEVARLGGYIENSSTNGVAGYFDETGVRRTTGSRRLYVTARVPQDKVDEFIGSLGAHGSILVRDESVTDVTLQYVDVESRKKALLAEQDRLLELLAQAETVEDLIAIEARMSTVRYELESHESQLRAYDNSIDYSTVTIGLQEVERITPPEEKSVWSRIGSGFETTLYRIGVDSQNLFVWVVVSLPYLIIWAVIITILCLVLKRFVARHMVGKPHGKQSKPEAQPQALQQDASSDDGVK